MVDASAKTSVRLLHPMGAAIAAEGGALEAVLSEAGIAWSIYTDPAARIPRTLSHDFFRVVAAHARHPAIGLVAAKHQDAAQFQMIEYLAASSPDVDSAVTGFMRFQSLITDAQVFSLTREGDDLLLAYEPGIDDLPYCLIEYVVGSLALVSRRSVRGRNSAEPLGSTWLRVLAPPHSPSYSAFFGNRVRYGMPANGLLIPGARLGRGLARSNPLVQQLLEPEAKGMLERIPAIRTVTEQVRRQLEEVLAGGDATLDAVAAKLHMSRSTLKRRLAGEGATFNEVLDGLRRDVAIKQLSGASASITEVAYLAGYEDVSAFHRAFKRWTGRSPADHRAELSPPHAGARRPTS